MSVFTDSAGGFIVMGIALAVIMAIENMKNTKKKVDARIKMQQEAAAKKLAMNTAAPATTESKKEDK